jgi:hypothetical protein
MGKRCVEMVFGRLPRVMREIVTGTIVIVAAAVALLYGIRNNNLIPARRMLSVTVCLLAVGLVVVSGCLFGNSRDGPAALANQTVLPSLTAAGAALATPAETPLTGGGACRQGQSACGGFCRDLTSDIGNCGACGKTCPSNSACKDSQCSCKDGYSASLDGTCHPAQTTAVPGCENQPGTKLCDSQCVDTDKDPGHCGSCSIQCSAGQNCVNGQCISPGGTTCNAGETLCNGQCSSLQTNPANCGACGHTCLSGQNCISGQCAATVLPCGNGQTTCDGQCVNTQTDVRNCGKCDYECMTSIYGYATGQICLSGQCTCPQGEINCDQSSITPDGVMNIVKCVDVKTDIFNCGKCGTTCTSSQTCSNGQCISKLGNIQKRTSFAIVTP